MATNSVITKVTGTDTSSNRIASTFYGTCTTAAATASKAVTLSDSCVFTDSCLVTGATIHVKFTNSNTNATPTLKVGTATAKQIMRFGTTKAGTTVLTSWFEGAVVSFTYDGTYWVMNDHIDGADISTKMDKVNPTGSGSFSLNSAGTTGNYSFAEGYACEASGIRAHSEGLQTVASGVDAHAEGSYSVASGTSSHAQGIYTLAQRKSQHTFGEYNIADTSGADTTVRGQYVEIVGNGTADNSRSNARTLDWSGNEVLSGTIEATGFGTVLDREVDRGGVQLTQAEYDALVQAGTVDADTTYFITDRNNTSSSYAAGIVYDNTNSGLDSTNVQGAIDELSAMSTQTSGSITKNSTYINTVERNGWYKVGRLVMFWMTATAKTTWTSTCQIGSGLPAPVNAFRFIGQIATSGSNVPLRLEIDSNGNIKNGYSITNPTAGQTIEFSGCYISAN